MTRVLAQSPRLPLLLLFLSVLSAATLPGLAQAQPSAAAAAAEIVPQTRHTLGINSAVASPGGRFVATSGEDQLIKLWDVKTGRLVRNVLRIPREVKFWRVDAIAEDGTRLLGLASDQINLWDTQSGKAVLTLPNMFVGEGSHGAAMSRDGKRVAVIREGGALSLYDGATGKEVHALKGHAGAVTAIAFSPDGRLLASGGQDRTVRLWDSDSGRPGLSVAEASEPVRSVSFAGNGRLVLARGTGELRLWDVEGGQLVWRHEEKEVAGADISADGGRVLVMLKGEKLEVWAPKAGSRISSFSQPDNSSFLAFSANGERLLFGPQRRSSEGDDAWITRSIDTVSGRVGPSVPGSSNSVWTEGRHLFVEAIDSSLSFRELETGREIQKFPGQPALTAAAFSMHGDQLATAGSSGVTVRDAGMGRRLGGCPASTADIRALAFSPDARRLIFGGADNRISLCDPERQQILRTFAGPQQTIRALAYSSDGKRILSGDDQGTVTAWSLETGRALWTAKAASLRDVTTVAFSPDGRRAFAGTDDNRVRILDAATGRELKLLRFLIGPVWALAVSPDGRRVAAAGYSEVLVKQWDVESGAELQRLSAGMPPGRFVMVHDISYSPAPGGLLAATANNRLLAWRVADGRRVLEATILDQELKTVAFSRDGRRLTAVDEAGAIRHWAVGNGHPLATVVPYGESDWLAVTPEGFFDASAGGREFLSRVRGLDARPLGPLEGDLHRPDLVAAKLMGDPKGLVREAAQLLDLSK